MVCLTLKNLNMKATNLYDLALLVMSVNFYRVGIWKHLTIELPKTLAFLLLATRWEKKVIKAMSWCFEASYP